MYRYVQYNFHCSLCHPEQQQQKKEESYVGNLSLLLVWAEDFLGGGEGEGKRSWGNGEKLFFCKDPQVRTEKKVVG